MSSIFISYRRDDSAPYAGRLYDRLSAHFGAAGEVFMDIDQIEPGEDFVEVIERKVGACETAVVLIGKGWLGAADARGARRLDDPADFVRLEVAAALQRGVRVVPVLVGGAAMPRATELPVPLAALSRRNAVELSDSRFHRDVDRLIAALARPATVRAQGDASAAAATSTHAREPAPASQSMADPPPAAVSAARPAALASPLQALLAAAVLAGAAAAAWQFAARAPAPAAPVADAPAPLLAAAPAQADPPAPTALHAAVEPPHRKEPAAASAVFDAKSMLNATRGVLDVWQAQAQAREASRRAAQAGGADAQYRFAVENECLDPKDVQEARRWYRLAAAQGHAGAKMALGALDAPPPGEAREREMQSVQRSVACLAELQKQSGLALDRMNEQARGAIRSIKAQ